MYYSIKEVASLLGESDTTLRYWEAEFPDVISPQRNNRVRFYTENDINDIRLIRYFIRDCRLTLDGVRKRLKNNKERAIRQAKIVQHLQHIKAELKGLMEAMDETEKQIKSSPNNRQ